MALKDVKTDFKVYKLWKDGKPGTEYFLAENRQQVNYDSHNPGAGLLVWHIDDTMSDNTNNDHYWVALLQADGKKDLEKLPAPGTEGDGGDPFPGSRNNKNLNDTTNPNSLSYAGLSTFVAIRNINQIGSDIVADIQVT